MKKVLVTGASGFIGFHVSKKFLKNGFTVLGIDALTDYYSVSLKKDRTKILKKYKNFDFINLNITNLNQITKVFKNFHPDIVLHFAAQPGVRHALKFPQNYMNFNILGTFNILECMRIFPAKHFLFASTSSIYGLDTKTPYKENYKTDYPISLYAATKKSCEIMIHSYSHLFKIPSTCFRFFTVYGPYGRPDMAYFKFTKNILEGKKIEVHNKGKMTRDFTFIDDLAKSIYLLKNKIPNKKKISKVDTLSPIAPFRIVNIGNSNNVNLEHFINLIEKIVNKKAEKIYVDNKKGELLDTFSSNELLRDLIKFTPNTNIDIGLSNFVNWYLDYYKIKE